MSEENQKTSQLNKTNTSSGHVHKKRYVVLQYIVIPILFVLISLVAVVPVSMFLLNESVDLVHKVQETLTMDYNDLHSSDEQFRQSDKTGGSVQLPKFVSSEKIGSIVCENAGLNTNLYYGLNRVSLRSGAAVCCDSSLFGENACVNIFGYASTAFKALYNMDIDDEIVVQTSWGKYSYRVVSCESMAAAPETDGNILVLSTSKNNKAFSNFDDEKYYVTAEYVSGPTVKGVQK